MHSAKLERREMLAWVLAGGLTLAVVGRLTIHREPAPIAPDDPSVGQARAAITSLMVRDSAAQRVPLASVGAPAILMVNSKTCQFCRLALKDIGELQGARTVPRLRIVTLEGADVGREIVEKLGVRGAFHAGPDGEANQVLLTFRIPGTPVFARTDSTGRIVETVPGYPGREVLIRWLPIMMAHE
jgi:hypothetical protein